MPEAGAGLGQVRNGKQPCAATGAMRSGRKEVTSFVDPGFQSVFLFILKVSLYPSWRVLAAASRVFHCSLQDLLP